MYFVGIDPGVKGAIAITRATPTEQVVEAIHDTPVVTKKTTTGKTRNRIDAMALHAILSGYSGIAGIVIEDVCARPGEGAVQAFGFGHGLGCIETVARLHGPVTMVPPRVWKHAYGLDADKGASRFLAQALTRDSQSLRRAKDDGRAEAFLLAAWGASDGLVEHQGKALDAYRASRP